MAGMATYPIELQRSVPDDKFRIEFDHEHGRAVLTQTATAEGERYTYRFNLRIVAGEDGGIDMMLLPDPVTGVHTEMIRDA